MLHITSIVDGIFESDPHDISKDNERNRSITVHPYLVIGHIDLFDHLDLVAYVCYSDELARVQVRKFFSVPTPREKKGFICVLQ